MLESIGGSSIGAAMSSLLRAQNVGTSAGLAALKSNQQATQAIINQLQQNLDQGKSNPAATLSSAQQGTLPRGSLVNILV